VEELPESLSEEVSESEVKLCTSLIILLTDTITLPPFLVLRSLIRRVVLTQASSVSVTISGMYVWSSPSLYFRP
ncbi:2916_t:CDS:1, partial [Entrophospora sp. SA101]